MGGGGNKMHGEEINQDCDKHFRWISRKNCAQIDE